MPEHISFILPAYNCESTIKEAILSIVHGNLLDDDEIVVVDDCSTDNTLAILKQLKKNYPQIRIFHSSWNKGSSATRNNAMEKVKNRYIFCLDSDNMLVQGSVRKLFD